MYPTDVVDWGLGTVPSFMRLSQAKTLALFVAATLRVGRVSLPAIALQAQSTIMLKHKIKRLWRFTDNDRVEVSDAMQGVVQKLLKRRKKRLNKYQCGCRRSSCRAKAAQEAQETAGGGLWARPSVGTSAGI